MLDVISYIADIGYHLLLALSTSPTLYLLLLPISSSPSMPIPAAVKALPWPVSTPRLTASKLVIFLPQPQTLGAINLSMALSPDLLSIFTISVGVQVLNRKAIRVQIFARWLTGTGLRKRSIDVGKGPSKDCNISDGDHKSSFGSFGHGR